VDGKVGLSEDRQGWRAEGGGLRCKGRALSIQGGQVATLLEQKGQSLISLVPQLPPVVPKGPVLILSATHRRYLSSGEAVSLSDVPDYWEFCEVALSILHVYQ